MAVDEAPGHQADGGMAPVSPGGPAIPVRPVRPAEPTIRISQDPPRAAGAPFTPRLPAGQVITTGRSFTTRLVSAAATARRFEPPAPLTNPLRHPLRWLFITAISLIAAIVFAHLGALFITGLYYLLFEVNSSATAWWHSVLPDAALRHAVRDVAEGFYGGAIAQQLVWNPFKARRTKYLAKPKTRLDRIEGRLRIPNLRSGRELAFWQIPYALAIWAPLYGSVGFTVTYLLDSVIRRDIAVLQHTVLALAPHASMLDRTVSMDTSDWDQKVMGLAASFFFGRRPLRKVFDGVQLWFAERHIARGIVIRWYHPPTFRARCHQVAANVAAGSAIPAGRHGRRQGVLLVITLVPVVALIGLGYYVLTFVAA